MTLFLYRICHHLYLLFLVRRHSQTLTRAHPSARWCGFSPTCSCTGTHITESFEERNHTCARGGNLSRGGVTQVPRGGTSLTRAGKSSRGAVTQVPSVGTPLTRAGNSSLGGVTQVPCVGTPLTRTGNSSRGRVPDALRRSPSRRGGGAATARCAGRGRAGEADHPAGQGTEAPGGADDLGGSIASGGLPEVPSEAGGTLGEESRSPPAACAGVGGLASRAPLPRSTEAADRTGHSGNRRQDRRGGQAVLRAHGFSARRQTRKHGE